MGESTCLVGDSTVINYRLNDLISMSCARSDAGTSLHFLLLVNFFFRIFVT